MHSAIVMYLPKLFAHASLILGMFAKMALTSLLLPTLVIILYVLALQKSKKKNIVWRSYIDWDNRQFFLYIDSSYFLMAGSQFLFCKEEIVAT